MHVTLLLTKQQTLISAGLTRCVGLAQVPLGTALTTIKVVFNKGTTTNFYALCLHIAAGFLLALWD